MTTQNAALDLFAELNSIDASELQDFTKIQTGGGRRLLPKGVAFVRPVYYVECGVQKQPAFDGNKPKDPAPMFEIGFAIVGGSGVNEEGKPERYVLEEGKYPVIKSYDKPISFFEKSTLMQIQAALNRVGNTATHCYQKIVESPLYQLNIGHKKQTKGKSAGQLKHEFDFRTLQPAWDAVRGEAVQMPEVDKSIIQVFLWDRPSIAQWDTLFIDGQYDAVKNEAGEITKPARSKNFIQEKILGALNFEGSPIQKVLQAAQRDVVIPVQSLEVPAETSSVQAPPDVEIPAGSTPTVPDLD